MNKSTIKNIKRYNMSSAIFCENGFGIGEYLSKETLNGDWVKYEDHISTVKELEKELKRTNELAETYLRLWDPQSM